jgi:hypothetical protein
VTPEPAPRAGRWALAWALLLAAHLGLTAYVLPPNVVFGDALIEGDDFDVHIGQTLRVLEGLNGWGKSWVYDVKLLAGQPEGTIFDGDNKGWELWTWALTLLGVPLSVAFNTFVLAAFLGVPVVVGASARLFGLTPAGGLVAAALACLLWFFDSFSRWVWWVGMIEYGFAAYFALLPLGVFHRFVRERRTRDAALTALVLGAAHVLHPYTFFVLVVPMGAMYLTAVLRGQGAAKRLHAGVAAIVVVTIACNVYWLLPAFAHWHYILDSGYYAQGGPQLLVSDFFDLLRDPVDTGLIGTLTGFRFFTLALAVGGLIALRRAHDPRALPLGVGFVTMLVFAYGSWLIPYSGQVQPYRHVLPLCFFGALLAGVFVEHALRERVLAGLGFPLRALLAALGLITVKHLSIDVAYFTPRLVPDTKLIFGERPSPVMSYGFLSTYLPRTHVEFAFPRDPLVELGVNEVVTWLDRNVPAGERVLIDNVLLGERTAWKTRLEVIGGFELRNIAHHYSTFFRRWKDEQASPAEVAEYLRTFAISHVVLQSPRADLARATDALEPLPDVGGRRIYRTRFAVSRVLQGGGSVRARTNRLFVSGSEPERDVVLSYHFHEQLVCEPGCRVELARVRFDDVGFVRVPSPHPRDFVVRLQY